MTQPVLPLIPADARSICPSVGLVEGPQGGVVVLGMLTHAWSPGDELSRRLAAVQLVQHRYASAVEVAAGIGVSVATVFRWVRAFSEQGAVALVRERTARARSPAR